MKGAPPMGGLHYAGPPIVMSAPAGLALTARLRSAYNRGPSVSEWRNW